MIPASGHTRLAPGQWAWQSRPQEAGKDGPLDTWVGEIIVRLSHNTPLPAVFEKGRPLAASDFPGVRLPASGRYWCAGLRRKDEKFDHHKYEVRWLGLDPEEALVPVDEHLIVPASGGGMVFALLDATSDIATNPIELPQNGTEPPSAPGDPIPVYAGSAFLPSVTPEVNPITGEYQRWRGYVETYSKDYGGLAIGVGNPLPASFRCTAPKVDPDGIISLDGNQASTGAKIIRVAQWWANKSQDQTGWRRASLSTTTLRRMGRVRVIQWRAHFEFTPDFGY